MMSWQNVVKCQRSLLQNRQGFAWSANESEGGNDKSETLVNFSL